MNPVDIQKNVIKKELYYSDVLVLKYTINYPKFYSDSLLYRKLVRKLNLIYQSKIVLYQEVNIEKLYDTAVEDYEMSVKNDFPIRVYEAYIDYQITYNQNNILSLYYDIYEYTGGAHGMTTRYSDSWDLVKQTEIDLQDLFPMNMNYQEYLIQNINKQIADEIAKGNNFYFEDYEKLVTDNFNPNNFYLQSDGIIMYYQLYEIAPYASGIRTFLIPYLSGELVLYQR